MAVPSTQGGVGRDILAQWAEQELNFGPSGETVVRQEASCACPGLLFFLSGFLSLSLRLPRVELGAEICLDLEFRHLSPGVGQGPEGQTA